MKEDNLSKLKQLLKTNWGFDDFRPKQLPVVASICEGQNTLAVLPTGGGKSICYQVPALFYPHLTIVISPLIALMVDQVKSLINKDIAAAALHGGIETQTQNEILQQAINGELKLLYISPERLTSKSFLAGLKSMKLSLIAVDEAHCISQWGHDFRPAYRNIFSLKALFPKVPILAVTATATVQVQADIIENLQLGESSSIVYPSRRDHLSYQVLRTENKNGVLLSFALNKPGVSGIVYARSRKLVGKITQYLKKRKVKVAAYHAGLDNKIKLRNQSDWIDGKIDLIVATNAFGMGIDKSNVRYVIHFDLPPNLEEYVQEAGRAGRDGQISEAIILLDKGDVEEKKRDVQKTYPPIHLIKDVYKSIASYYNLAVGEKMHFAKSFQLISFCEHYGLPVLPSFYAIRMLDKMNYLLLTDSFYHSSTLKCNKEQLDLFESVGGHVLEKALIGKILRIYDGTFYKQVKIDEEYLAEKIGATLSEVTDALSVLDGAKVIDYEKGGNTPKIKIRGPRLHSDKVKISEELYGLRKQRAFDRLAALEKYLDEVECRQINIDHYFGFDGSQYCGICDLCKLKVVGKIDRVFIQQKIIDLLKKEVNTIEALIEQFTEAERKELVSILETMESDRIISIVSNNVILER